MNKKGYTTKELLITIAVFTVIYVIGVISVSHAFKTDAVEESYDSILNLMTVQAEKYASDNSDSLFKDSDTATIYANDLVKKNYYKADEYGNIVDPRDTSKNLNDTVIEIIKDGKTYKASIAS